MVSGVRQPYIFIIWSNILLRNIDVFHSMVGGVVASATLNVYMGQYILHAVLK